MVGLLFKDICIHKAGIAGCLAGMTFSSVMPIGFAILVGVIDGDEFLRSNYVLVELIFYYLLFAIAGASQQGIFASDERKIWAEYIASTPMLVKGQVASKYLFSLCYSAAALLLCVVEAVISSTICGMNSGAAAIPFLILFIQLIMRAVEFPFDVRFTSKHGNTYRSIFFFIFFFIVLVYALFGDLSVFSSFETLVARLGQFLDNMNASAVFLACMIILSLVSVTMYYFSYRISCRLYTKGAEGYDN